MNEDLLGTIRRIEGHVKRIADSLLNGTATAPPAEEETTLLSANDIAQMLSSSSRTVYRLSADGEMPNHVMIGSLKRWKRSEIKEWIEQGGFTPSAE